MRFKKTIFVLSVTSFVTFFVIFKLSVFSSDESIKLNSKKSQFQKKIEADIHLSTVPTSVHANFHFNKSKIILLWTAFFSKVDYIPPLDSLYCPESRCQVTSNRSLINVSDAVMFHVRDINLEDMPSVKYPWQRWILLHHESPPHTPNVLKPLNGLINWTITYRLDSDIVLNPQVVRRPKPIPHNDYNFAANKTRMVAWFSSNCHTPSNREEFVDELKKNIPVDIFGSCGQKSCLPKMAQECYHKIAKDYRFYFSFENSICKDYATEKFFFILDTNMIPVVFGGADYTKLGPPNSFINALSFHSPRELAQYLLSVARDDNKYNSYFDWKQYYMMKGSHYACEICRKLHDKSESLSVYKNLHQWWFDEAKCKRWMPNRIL